MLPPPVIFAASPLRVWHVAAVLAAVGVIMSQFTMSLTRDAHVDYTLWK